MYSKACESFTYSFLINFNINIFQLYMTFLFLIDFFFFFK